MNNTINIKRFGWVLGKDIRENWKRYALQFLVLFGVITIVFFILSNARYKLASLDFGSQITDFGLLNAASILFAIFGILFSSTLMEPMRSKVKRIAYLSNPASDLEKFLSRWLIVTVGFVIAFCCALWMADLLRVAVFSVRFPKVDVRMIDWSRLVFPGEKHGTITIGYLFPHRSLFGLGVAAFLFCQSLYVLGATFWEKSSFMKTFAALCIISLLYIPVARLAYLWAFPDPDAFAVSMNMLNLGSDINSLWYVNGVLLLMAVVNWVLAGFRFRESEIIRRL